MASHDKRTDKQKKEDENRARELFNKNYSDAAKKLNEDNK